MDKTATPNNERIAAYYEALIAKYGHDPRSCDYGRPESQQKKFRVLSEVCALSGKRLLDVGCGFADYADFLHAAYPTLTYEGVDITASMIREAKRLHPGLSLRVFDILDDEPGGPYDVVSANGIFYLLGPNAEILMQRLIQRMFTLCTEALAFNSLSTWATDPEANEFYADPQKIITFCRTLSPWVVLRHDYSPRDFTLYLYKRPLAL